MSYTQKDLIESILNRQEKQDREVRELKNINSTLIESDKAKQAKEVAFSDKLEGLRSNFSSFFNRQPSEKGAV